MARHDLRLLKSRYGLQWMPEQVEVERRLLGSKSYSLTGHETRRSNEFLEDRTLERSDDLRTMIKVQQSIKRKWKMKAKFPRPS